MKKTFLLLCLCLIAGTTLWAQKPKYIFYFIGDGMGLNQVQATEYYQGELAGEIKTVPLLFSGFPYQGFASTYSATNGVTDSAAGGTALATGHKTRNGAIGMLKDLTTPIYSVAVWAKEMGMRIGIATSVSVDHATPASFYAHVPKRKNYFEIGQDLYKTGFDFYAGSDFLKPTKEIKGATENLYTRADQEGYTIARGYTDYVKKAPKASKMILLQTEAASRLDNSSIPFAIDRKEGDMSLEEITRAGIDFLSKDLSRGFFFMVEGGKIDWSCHSNDAATTIHEVIDLDKAIRIAYEFYEKYPEETLIVITADHETGGLALGSGPYALNLKALQHQKISEYAFTRLLNNLREESKGKVSWDTVKDLLTQHFGFWKELKLTEDQEEDLKETYDKTFGENAREMESSEYYKTELIAAEAKKIMSQIALLTWGSGGHSAGYVPVYAIGKGAQVFSGKMENIDIPHRIATLAGFKTKE